MIIVQRAIATSVFISLTLVTGCSKQSSQQINAAANPSSQAAASHETPAPMTAGAAEQAGTVQGQVLEVLDSGGYTYVRVKTDRGDVWAATTTFAVAKGDMVIVPLENPMRNFHSPTMKRDFDLVYFASRITRPGETSAAPESMGAAQPDAKLIDPVPPAPGGTSIANVWTNRKSLAGKIVTVRGKVMKYNAAIMGLNWLHVQDGSGSVKDGTHDLTVTSTTESRVGDIVTVTGTVVIDKNFGAGYGYAVMLQGAKIAR